MKITRMMIVKALCLTISLTVIVNLFSIVKLQFVVPSNEDSSLSETSRLSSLYITTNSRHLNETKNSGGTILSTRVPPNIYQMFPLSQNISLSLPPLRQQSITRSKGTDISFQSVDIFRILKKWGNISTDFTPSYVSNVPMKEYRNNFSPYKQYVLL